MMGEKGLFHNEDDMLMDEGKTSNKNGKYEKNSCYQHWKIVLAGVGVIVLISLGFVIGTALNHKHDAETSKVRRTQNIRLPNSIVPIKYRLYLHPNITNAIFNFTGYVRILVEAKKSTDQIILHNKDLQIVKVEVFKGDEAIKLQHNALNLPVEGFAEDKKAELLKINLKHKLQQSQKYVVHIKFRGSLSNGLEGFYKSSYKTKSGETRYLATTHFEATHARAAFPCFDEPSFKANFSIIIVHEKQHTALSNMPSLRNTTRADGLVVEEFKESVKMSTYLVAFVVCDYAFKEGTTKNNVKVKVWAPKEQIEQANFAVETAVKVLDYYDKFFQVPFPLPKQDLIAIPDFGAGAMENWGLITYRLTSILYDEKESSSANKQWVAVVIAHELAHQWFGNLVTMKWWNDLWLNEGFAAFVEFIGADITNPGWKMMDQFIVDDTQSSLALDSHANSHPISVPVYDPAQINEIFDTISYDKGASIIRMMKAFLTKDVFHAGLTNYLKKYQFSNAVSDDLWACMTAAQNTTGKAKIDVKSVMDTWTLQMGYPVITITRDKEDKETALVTQKHFLVDVDTTVAKSPFDYKWDVPLTFFYEKKPEHQMKWFNRSASAIKISWNPLSGWIKANIDQIGFYRVNYEQENWNALAKQLKDNHKVLSTSDRANLIDDVFELAKANLVSQIKALDMTEYLTAEKEYVPWITALSSIAYIGALLQGRKGYPNYEKYIVQQVAPMVNELGWKDTDTHLKKYLRGAILRSSVAHNDSSSVKEALRQFNNWMDKNESIPANLRSVMYSAGIKYGGQKEWDFMWKLYQTTPYPSEQRKLMFSLTESTDPEVLKKYLSYSLDSSKIRSQDSCSVVEHIAMNPKGSKLATQFVKDHWNEFYKRYGKGSFDMSRLIKAIFGRGKTVESLHEAEAFLTSHKLGSGKLAGKQAIAAIKNHIDWLEKNEANVENWLKDKISASDEMINIKS